MHDTDTTNLLPIYVILGARDFFQKKMRIGPKLGQIGEMVIKRGWVMMSLGKESDIVTAVYSKRYVNDYEKLCDTS